MEIATCSSSSFSLLGTKFRCIFSQNNTQKKKTTVQYSIPPLNGGTKAMAASGSSSSGVWNGHARPNTFTANTNANTNTNTANSRIYSRMDSCLVIPPPLGKKPRAIIKFLGGAFIGAVPEVTYRSLFHTHLSKLIFYFFNAPENKFM